MREAEKSRQSNMTPDGYRASATRARQQDQPYGSNVAPVYGQAQQPQPAMQQYDQYGRAMPQQTQYQPDYPPSGQQYSSYGQTAQFGVANSLQSGRQQPSQTYPQVPAVGYLPQGRGMDTGYGLQDSRTQGFTGAYDGGLGRSQPMAQQAQYPASGQSLGQYDYQRGA